jgi:hypothetical protein
MSVVPEVISARHCGLKVVAVSAITNLAEGLGDVKLSHEQTLAARALTPELHQSYLRFSAPYCLIKIKWPAGPHCDKEQVMNITTRLKMMSFMQYFIWGSWLVTLGSYMINTLHFTGSDVGMVYSSKGLAAIVMPSLVGIIADKWLRADRAYMICHLVCAAALCYAAQVNEPGLMFWVMLVNAMAFMPTIALSNTISYSCLEQAGWTR